MKGYRQTEVGVIPEDWGICNLASVSSKITDGDHLTPRRTKQGYFLLSARNIRDSYIDLSDVDYVGFEEYNRMRKRCAPQVGDLLISCSGHGLGRISAVPENLECVLVRSAALVKLDPKKADCYFTQYWLQGSHAQNQISCSKSLAAQPNLFINSIAKLRCPLPNGLNEQRAIATALSNVDALITTLDQLLAKKRDLKQAAMQQLLTGKTRLPGFKGKWKVERLGALATISKGAQLSNEDANAEGLHPYLNGGIFPSGYSNSANKPANTIAISEGGNSCGYVQFVKEPFWCGGHCYAVVPRNIDNACLYHLLKAQQTAIMKLRVGSGLPNVQKTAINSFFLTFPDDSKEQTAIATVLSDMDAELTALESRLDKTRSLKQAMMQELLTGKTRLVQKESKIVTINTESKKAPATKPSSGNHNWVINEAVVVAVLVKHFGSEQFPLGRKRCTKLSYLLHRHVEHVAQGYLKKAAGPYNPAVKYKGPEGIAKKNGYIRPHQSGKYSGFVASKNIVKAESYFEKWYGGDALAWLEQFRCSTNNELERLATVDMAMEELRRAQKNVSLASVRDLIASEPEWVPKLDRDAFADTLIAAAIRQCEKLFP